jgi:hypothetical protein
MMVGGLRTVIRFGKRPRPRDLAKQIVERFLNGADIKGRIPANGSRPYEGSLHA